MTGPKLDVRTLPQPLRIEIEVLPDAVPGGAPARDDTARPTLVRPHVSSSGLFQGWGPKLR